MALSCSPNRAMPTEPYQPQTGQEYSRLLFELTCFLAIASCSSIWFCKCFSRFDSISSVLRRPKMAFFVLSFFFAALPPQRLPKPQLAILKGCCLLSTARRATRCVFCGPWKTVWSGFWVVGCFVLVGSLVPPRCWSAAGLSLIGWRVVCWEECRSRRWFYAGYGYSGCL
jgi:hypothetical protein